LVGPFDRGETVSIPLDIDLSRYVDLAVVDPYRLEFRVLVPGAPSNRIVDVCGTTKSPVKSDNAVIDIGESLESDVSLKAFRKKSS